MHCIVISDLCKGQHHFIAANQDHHNLPTAKAAFDKDMVQKSFPVDLIIGLHPKTWHQGTDGGDYSVRCKGFQLVFRNWNNLMRTGLVYAGGNPAVSVPGKAACTLLR